MDESQIQELDEIVAKAIPFSVGDCYTKKQKKIHQREVTRIRMLNLINRLVNPIITISLDDFNL